MNQTHMSHRSGLATLLLFLKDERQTLRWTRAALLIVLSAWAAPAQVVGHSRQTPPAPAERPPRVALVLGGGGARGLAHVGVLQVLEGAKIPVDLIVGTSAGSIVGALYADQPDAKALRDLLNNVRRKDFVDFSLLHILNGPITGNALEKFLQTNMRSRDFSDLRIRFVAVATDLGKGEVFPIDSGLIAPAVHASAALPPYFHSVSIEGRTLVDGGVTAPLPVSVALKYHPQVVIAVNVAGPLSPTMPKNSLCEVARSFSITLNVLAQISGGEAHVVIIPDVGTASTFNISDKEDLFDAGVKAGNEALPRIKKVLAKKGIIPLASP